MDAGHRSPEWGCTKTPFSMKTEFSLRSTRRDGINAQGPYIALAVAWCLLVDIGDVMCKGMCGWARAPAGVPAQSLIALHMTWPMWSNFE